MYCVKYKLSCLFTVTKCVFACGCIIYKYQLTSSWCIEKLINL